MRINDFSQIKTPYQTGPAKTSGENMKTGKKTEGVKNPFADQAVFSPAGKQPQVKAVALKHPEAQDMERLYQEIYAFDDRYFPSEASDLGLHQNDDQLESFTPEELGECRKFYREAQAKLSGKSYSALPPRQKAEYLMVRSRLSRRENFLSHRKDWQKDPSFYTDLAMHSIYGLLSRDFAPLKVRLKSAEKRLLQFSRLFSQAKANLVNPPKIFTEIALEAVNSSQNLFTADLEKLARQAPELEAQLLSARDAGLSALNDYGRFLEEEMLPLSKGDFAIGKTAFDKILTEEKLLKYNHQELWELGHQLFQKTEKQLIQLSEIHYPGKNWQEVIALLSHDHPSGEKLIQTYRQAAHVAKEFVASRGLVNFPPEEQLQVMETPEFIRGTIPFAAYFPPAAYETGGGGQLWVTPVNLKLSADQQENHLREHPFSKIHYTVSHEAYPGHHLQFSWIPALSSDVLKRSHEPLFIEGWAFYCEDLMKEQGYLGKEGQFAQLKAQIWRAARVILDVGLHTEKISLEDAVRFLREKVGMDRNFAWGEVKRYAKTPTQPLSYYVGKLEILKLKKLFAKQIPGLKLKDFHQMLLNCGSMPPALIPVYYGIKSR